VKAAEGKSTGDVAEADGRTEETEENMAKTNQEHKEKTADMTTARAFLDDFD